MKHERLEFYRKLIAGFQMKTTDTPLTEEQINHCFSEDQGLAGTLEKKLGEHSELLEVIFERFAQKFPAPAFGWEMHKEDILERFTPKVVDAHFHNAAQLFVGRMLVDEHTNEPALLDPVSLSPEDGMIIHSFIANRERGIEFNGRLLSFIELDTTRPENSKTVSFSHFMKIEVTDKAQVLQQEPEVFEHNGEPCYGLCVQLGMQNREDALSWEDKWAVDQRRAADMGIIAIRKVPEVEQLKLFSPKLNQELTDVLLDEYFDLLISLFATEIHAYSMETLNEVYGVVLKYAREVDQVRTERAKELHQQLYKHFLHLLHKEANAKGEVHFAHVSRNTSIHAISNLHSDLEHLSFEEMKAMVESEGVSCYAHRYSVRTLEAGENPILLFAVETREKSQPLVEVRARFNEQTQRIEAIEGLAEDQKTWVDPLDERGRIYAFRDMLEGFEVINTSSLMWEQDAIKDGEEYLKEVQETENLSEFFEKLRNIPSSRYPSKDYILLK